MQAGGHAEQPGAGQVLGQAADQPVAAQAEALAGGPQVAVVGAGLQEGGEGELVEGYGAAGGPTVARSGRSSAGGVTSPADAQRRGERLADSDPSSTTREGSVPASCRPAGGRSGTRRRSRPPEQAVDPAGPRQQGGAAAGRSTTPVGNWCVGLTMTSPHVGMASRSPTRSPWPSTGTGTTRSPAAATAWRSRCQPGSSTATAVRRRPPQGPARRAGRVGDAGADRHLRRVGIGARAPGPGSRPGDGAAGVTGGVG